MDVGIEHVERHAAYLEAVDLRKNRPAWEFYGDYYFSPVGSFGGKHRLVVEVDLGVLSLLPAILVDNLPEVALGV